MVYFKQYYSLLLVLYILIAAQACTNGNRVTLPQVEKGTIDLRDWDFEKNGTLKLNGEWEFYWKYFLMDSIQDTSQKPIQGFVHIPGLWNHTNLDSIHIPKYGYASYRLKVQSNTGEELAIKYLNSATTCEIYIDGTLLFNAGQPGKSENTSHPSYKPGIISFTPQGKEFEIVLQISNFHHHKGGQWEPIILGKKSQINQYHNRRIFIELIFIGSLMVMALSHLIIFFRHSNETPLYYFGIFALIVGLRFIVSGEYTIYLLGDFNWKSLVQIDYLSFYLSVLFFLYFIRSLYPNEVNKFIASLITSITLLFSASVIFLQPSVFSYGIIYFQIITIVAGFYGVFILIQAIRHKREGALFFVAGFVILLFCTIHDILKENDILYSISLVPSGLTLFMLLQAAALSLKIRKTLITNEELSDELKKQNYQYAYLNKKYKSQNKNLKLAKEKAEESDRFKSAFLANISHEIRTPMNGILGFATLLNKKELPEEKREKYLRILNERGHHLLGVVNDIIDISKIETGQIEIRNEMTCINDLIDEVYHSYHTIAEEKKLTLIKTISLPYQQSRVLVDKLKLTQILENLISNAIKFTKKGKVEFGYQLSDNFIEFYIKDSGIGLSEKEMAIIFNRFNQANQKIAQIYGGTGLGLAIVKAYVEKLGGKIWIQSKEGIGSTFHFTIPYYPQGEIQMDPLETKENLSSNHQLLILLVEDNVTNTLLVKEILEDTNIKVIHAGNGFDTIHLFKKNPAINLVLMDIKLPDADGYELCKKLIQIRENIPIIAQTAFALKGDKERAIHSGCVDYIAKPIDQEELIKKIYKHALKTKG